MPPKRKDKGKRILKDAVPQTPSKDSQTSPPKEKLLSSAMPIKSWIDMIEDEESKSKALTTHEQVNQWMKSISKSPELMLALQSFSQSQISPQEEIEKEKTISKEISKPSSQMLFSLVKVHLLRLFFPNQHLQRKLSIGMIKPISKTF